MPTGGRRAALDEHLNALWYLLRNGCAWRALPDVFGNWFAIFQYFNRLSKDGFFDWLHEQLLLGKEAEVVFEDSTHCKVHQHANGAKDRTQEAVGRSRGGLNTKIHAVCDALLRLAGKLVLTGGNVSDHTAAPELTAQLHDCVVGGDKGYDSRKHRADLRSRGCEPCVPSRKNTGTLSLTMRRYIGHATALRISSSGSKFTLRRPDVVAVFRSPLRETLFALPSPPTFFGPPHSPSSGSR